MDQPERIDSFRDLVVWQVAMEVADKVLALSECEPLRGRYWLVGQICAAASSVAANIAEGHGGSSRRQFLKHLYIARGSLAETMTFVDLIRRRSWFSEATLAEIDALLNRCGRLLSGLIRALRQPQAEPHQDSQSQSPQNPKP
jgi:four helix bundle protein